MLLLVLILVLIAFGLLVVALLSGSVLWAWVSVGVSIAAAAVLLIDWLQRRAAVKAGPESVSETRVPGTISDIEPVTEMLAVVPPAVPPGAAGGPGTPAERRIDAVADSQQTMVMPVIQPSGSPTRPPGAESDVTSSSGFSSPSVTTSGSDRPASSPAPAGATTPHGPADDDATVLAPVPTEARRDPERRPDGNVSGDPEATVMVDIRKRSSGTPDDATAASPPPALVAAHDPEPAQPASGSTAATAGATAAAREGTVPATGSVPSESSESSGGGRVASDGPVRGDPVRGDTARGDTARGDTARGDTARGDTAPDVAAEAGDGPAGGSVVGGAAEATVAGGEAPVEPHDPAAAALVAGLDDDVVVIDEHPRYHIAGCRALATAQAIPLPAREAVELGFTPCGWCSPDRTLAGRHPATAR